jgi:hypothetical protein
MTVRAFILGLIAVVGICMMGPYGAFITSYGWVTENAFPPAAVFALVFFTIILNLVIRLVRRRWALKQAELMLIWCMATVSCTVTAEGLMSYFFPMLAAPAYVARRADIAWQDTALEAAPEGLLLSKNPRSVGRRTRALAAVERHTRPLACVPGLLLPGGILSMRYPQEAVGGAGAPAIPIGSRAP